MKPRDVAIVVFGSLLLAITQQVQADSELDRRSLVGLKGVEVVVEQMRPEAEQDGLSHSTLQTDVELKLRQAGIVVYTNGQSFSIPGAPWLYLNVGTLKIRRGPSEFYAYNVELFLLQRVSLIRSPNVTVSGITWKSTGVTGVAGMNLLGKIRDDVRDAVDEFINAYLAVNPKQ